MSEYVIVRINDQLIPEFQINYAAKSKTSSKTSVSAWSSIVVKNNETLILIISANLVLTTAVKIPSKSDEIIRQSIPFIIEEHIANEIDDNHYSYQQISEQNFLVSVINKNIIEEIQQNLITNHLKCTQLYSEIFTIPYNRKKTSLLISDNYILARDKYSGSLLTHKMLTSYLHAAQSESQEIYSQNNIDETAYPQGKFNRLNTDILQCMTIVSEGGVNVFQGQYEQNDDNKAVNHPWKKLMVLSIILVISWLFMSVYQITNLSSDIEKLKINQSQLFIKHVNNASETEKRDPYSAFQSRLQQNQTQNNANTKTGFIKSLTFLGKTLTQHPLIKVQGLRQRDTKLEVTLQAQNTNALNLFQSDLEKNVLFMRVKTGTRESNNEGVNSVITMENL